MKWFSSRYAYPLIVLSLVVSIALQAVWLRQLFVSQKDQLKKDLERVVSTSAIHTIYASIAGSGKRGDRFKEFFLSPQWLQMRQAFDDLKINGVHSKFHYGLGSDSSVVQIEIVFNNHSTKKEASATDLRWNDESPGEVVRIDNRDIKTMDSTVSRQLARLGINQSKQYALYGYGKDTLTSMTIPQSAYNTAAYHSGKYSYNLKSMHKYRLIVNELNGVVIYQMRYYLFSSLLMTLLTCLVFYFLLKLIRNQRLYADAKSTFTSNMTHEFKTPVATISVALESITKYQLVNDPEKLQNYLDISRHELQRLNLMIEKVLNLSQEEETSNIMHEELYDVQAGLKQVVASMQVQLDNSKSTIHLSLANEPCFVNGDPLHLTNVFYNLIDNAIKYAGPQMEMQISCQCSANNITLSFKDNGPGIAGVYQEKVFDRFFRIPGVNDRHNVKGSGLGLHYVKQIISKHGGSISIKSEQGRGSNFIIILPAAV
ncbi:sensor histidine kinase [Mucilaginibacter sp. OK098]|uniref:sensor histidine kinase n=1 Tax=Mucilaginibacter sp. OK098 TaxID=1855297 RepID=UPI0009152DF3|nr:HAMP domain-containing sensor histidine kinase [Mucilaginibacter sp. OK098]SHM74803.1 Signal transduction histidine kinase [Mucilaginibacter sp. OK098]